jgi:hypothetical protein
VSVNEQLNALQVATHRKPGAIGPTLRKYGEVALTGGK